jgi:iron complex outermembrane receptor protein
MLDFRIYHRLEQLKARCRQPLAALAAAFLVITPAYAQPGAEPSRTHMEMPAQALSTALLQVGRQTGVEITFAARSIRRLRAPALQGDFTVEEALARLLAGTKLSYRQTPQGGYAILAEAPTAEQAPLEGIAEVLVTSAKTWSLNAGVARTEDDPQPWVIFNHEQIAQSGANNLEQFLRDNLTSAAGAGTSDQAGTSTPQGLSSLNLRGLGQDNTLVLIDGRRAPAANNVQDYQQGFEGQGQITGIPLAAIERVEVLSSSASSIYGASASGGVVNIVLRRDYKGLVLSASDAGTYDGGGGERRFDASGSTHLEGGRTDVSFSASYRDSDPVLQGDRDLYADGIQHVLSSTPNYFSTGSYSNLPILGSTANIHSANGTPLVFKDGTPLGAPITYAPAGYPGFALGGAAPLIANAGRYNYNLAPTADGALAPLILGSKLWFGSVSARREFSSWLRLYGDVSASRSETSSPGTRVPNTYTLLPSAPDNPFKQTIQVSAPQYGASTESDSRQDTLSALGGAIIKLPYRWEAAAEFSYSRSRYSSVNGAGTIDAATNAAILNGSLDILSDGRKFPLNYTYGASQVNYSGQTPSASSAYSPSLRVAGPLPFDLPGGAPVVTTLLEQNRTDLTSINVYNNVTALTGPPFGVTNVSQLTPAAVLASQSANLYYYAPRSDTTRSAYSEIRFPIIAQGNSIPFVQALEVQLSARYDHYEEEAGQAQINGANNPQVNCLAVKRPLQPSDFNAPCPPASTPFVEGDSARHSTNPTLSLRWQVEQDVALRASYGQGFRPPLLNQLTPSAPFAVPVGALSAFGFSYFHVTDPLRGNEVIGSTVPTVTVTSGGNPNVQPETSKSWSLGLILTPRIVPDLRVAVDWTRIDRQQVYIDPSIFLTASPLINPEVQQEFDAFLAVHPERFQRGAPSGGFKVGPIIGIDATTANMVGARSESWDFSINYHFDVSHYGQIGVTARATRLSELEAQLVPGVAPEHLDGVVGGLFSSGLGTYGGLRWRANTAVTWSTEKWSVGARAQYFDHYLLSDVPGYVAPGQGSATVPSQIYFDLFGRYKFPHALELRVSLDNVLNRAPPVDVNNTAGFYSRFGDPRMGRYYLTLTKSF